MSNEHNKELERETICGNCRKLLYQNANPNNIHWYHTGTGDVRCPTTFAQPISRASVAAPQSVDAESKAIEIVDEYKQRVMQMPWCGPVPCEKWLKMRLRIAFDLLSPVAPSPTPPDALGTAVVNLLNTFHGSGHGGVDTMVSARLRGCEKCAVLSSVLDRAFVTVPADVSPSQTPEQKTCAWCKEKIVMMYFGSDGRRYCSINCQLQYEAETRRAGVNWESTAPPSTKPSARVAAEEIKAAIPRLQWSREIDVVAEIESIISRHFPSVQPVEEQTLAPCVNCSHSDPHDGPAGTVDDACTHEGCNCGYYVAKE